MLHSFLEFQQQFKVYFILTSFHVYKFVQSSKRYRVTVPTPVLREGWIVFPAKQTVGVSDESGSAFPDKLLHYALRFQACCHAASFEDAFLRSSRLLPYLVSCKIWFSIGPEEFSEFCPTIEFQCPSKSINWTGWCRIPMVARWWQWERSGFLAIGELLTKQHSWRGHGQ